MSQKGLDKNFSDIVLPQLQILDWHPELFSVNRYTNQIIICLHQNMCVTYLLVNKTFRLARGKQQNSTCALILKNNKLYVYK